MLRNASLRSRKRYFLHRTGFFRFKFLHLTLTTVECFIGYSIYFSLATIKRVFSFQIDWLRPKGPRFEGHDIEANSVIYALTYKLTNIFSKEACLGHSQSRPQPELVGFAAIIFLWYDKPEAYFAKEATDTHRNENCWKKLIRHFTELS